MCEGRLVVQPTSLLLLVNGFDALPAARDEAGEEIPRKSARVGSTSVCVEDMLYLNGSKRNLSSKKAVWCL